MHNKVQNIFESAFYTGKNNIILIRGFERGDIGRIYEIECQSFKEPYHPLFLVNLSELYRDTFLVALENGVVVGYMISRVADLSGHVLAIAVDSEKRGKGIGTALMEVTMTRLRECGVKDMWLEVRVSNHDAIEFYKKLGFMERGIARAYYLDMEDATVLRKLI